MNNIIIKYFYVYFIINKNINYRIFFIIIKTLIMELWDFFIIYQYVLL